MRDLVHAGGHLVVAGEDRGRARLAEQQLLGRGDAGFEGVAAFDDARLRQRDAALRQRLDEARGALDRRAVAPAGR